jgi:signal peptidase I
MAFTYTIAILAFMVILYDLIVARTTALNSGQVYRTSDLAKGAGFGLIVLVSIISFRLFVKDFTNIPTASMEPTIPSGSRGILNRWKHGVFNPITNLPISLEDNFKHGDIVAFKSPLEPYTFFVKRVIGLPGDVVELRDRQVYVNGKLLEREVIERPQWSIEREQKHLAEHPDDITKLDALKPLQYFKEYISDTVYYIQLDPNIIKTINKKFVISEKQYFLLGDNRQASFDSRYFGLVDREYILGSIE